MPSMVPVVAAGSLIQAEILARSRSSSDRIGGSDRQDCCFGSMRSRVFSTETFVNAIPPDVTPTSVLCLPNVWGQILRVGVVRKPR